MLKIYKSNESTNGYLLVVSLKNYLLPLQCSGLSYSQRQPTLDSV